MKPSLFLLIPLLSTAIFAASPTTSSSAQSVDSLGINFVTVGDPNNPADPVTNYGAVLDSFKMSKYDITAEQWCSLLNHVAKHADPNMLYDDRMNSDANVASIKRTGDAVTGYTYAPISSATAKLPIVYVSWFSAARFCNWIHNSTLAGHLLEGNEDATTTEKGAYDLTVPVQVFATKYVDFLNSAASIEGPNNLHSNLYAKENAITDLIKCTKDDSGKYSYSLQQSDSENASSDTYLKVSWASAARFMNWMYNVEVTNNPQQYSQDEITEKGLFDISAGLKDITGHGNKTTVFVVPTDYAKLSDGAKCYLASEDQWYKGGYFKANQSGSQARFTGSNYTPEYWIYPTASDKAPVNYLTKPSTVGWMAGYTPYDKGNGANYYVSKTSDNNQNDGYPEYTVGAPDSGPKNCCLTPVGYFTKTQSHYGLFDMAGNVSQWLGGSSAHDVTYPDGHTEWQYAGVTRPIRGGGWGKVGQCPTGPKQFAKETSMVIDASVRRNYIGFRVAAPATPSEQTTTQP